jgi:OOP family OmpA-OmpF porin
MFYPMDFLKMTSTLPGAFGKTLLVAAALAVSSLASAQVYLGGSVGQSMAKFDSSDFQTNNPQISENSDKTKTAYKFFAGYGINSYFAVEGGYADLGEPSYSYAGQVSGNTAKDSLKQSAWFVAAKGTLPINEQFNLFGKLGVTYNKVKYSGYETWSNTSASTSDSRSGVLYGIGAEYKMMKQLGIRLEYEDFGKFGGQFTEDGEGTGRLKTSMWSVGVAHTF